MLFKLNISLIAAVITMLLLAANIPTKEDTPTAKNIIGWAVQKTSTIQIKGATNINSFGCNIADYTLPDTIFCTREATKNQQVLLTGELKVDISKFDCHNKMMTHDMRQTLKATEYPVLLIRFLSLERAPSIINNKDCLKGWVAIELAGCTKKFEVNYSFVATGSSLIQLNGNRNFSFSDFNLKAPKKFAGLVKVKDNLAVDFNLLLDPVE